MVVNCLMAVGVVAIMFIEYLVMKKFESTRIDDAGFESMFNTFMKMRVWLKIFMLALVPVMPSCALGLLAWILTASVESVDSIVRICLFWELVILSLIILLFLLLFVCWLFFEKWKVSDKLMDFLLSKKNLFFKK